MTNNYIYIYISVDLERTWSWLFWAYLIMVILSVPDHGYFERTWSWLFWAYLMMVILSVPDHGYLERTWSWLFWAYPMMVILSVPDHGYSRNASCALNCISTFLFICIKLNRYTRISWLDVYITSNTTKNIQYNWFTIFRQSLRSISVIMSFTMKCISF
jgi:hypothetical protein